jgi:hypothetical protein
MIKGRHLNDVVKFAKEQEEKSLGFAYEARASDKIVISRSFSGVQKFISSSGSS